MTRKTKGLSGMGSGSSAIAIAMSLLRKTSWAVEGEARQLRLDEVRAVLHHDLELAVPLLALPHRHQVQHVHALRMLALRLAPLAAELNAADGEERPLSRHTHTHAHTHTQRAWAGKLPTTSPHSAEIASGEPPLAWRLVPHRATVSRPCALLLGAIDGAKARRDHGALCVCDHKSECSRLEVLKVRVGGSRAVCVVSGGRLASSTRRNPAGRECACSEVGHAGAKLLEQGRALVCLCSP